ncbi:hypothetical protein [Geobacillus jurassicus]|nr:hypothetical protein [Geobacillus jurassicus]
MKMKPNNKRDGQPARAVDAKAAGRASTSMREQAVQDACKEREELTAD